MKRALISTIVSRWIELPDDADDDSLNDIEGLFDGIDLDMYDAADFEIVDEEAAE